MIRSEYNFSIELYNGQWIQRAILPSDVPPETDKQKEAIEYWRQSNIRKFVESQP